MNKDERAQLIRARAKAVKLNGGQLSPHVATAKASLSLKREGWRGFANSHCPFGEMTLRHQVQWVKTPDEAFSVELQINTNRPVHPLNKIAEIFDEARRESRSLTVVSRGLAADAMRRAGQCSV